MVLKEGSKYVLERLFKRIKHRKKFTICNNSDVLCFELKIIIFYTTGLTPIKPSFKDKTGTAYLRVGFPGWLSCTVIADPRAKIFWGKGKMWPDSPLNEFDFIQFSNGSVFVKKVRQEFEGQYFCTAANSGGYQMKTLSVEVGGIYFPFYIQYKL